MSRGAEPGDLAAPQFTIDELAAAAAVPSRTIREYQSIGLLPSPERVGRVGVYRAEHRHRLELIARLQKRGYSLAGIKDLFDARARGRTLDDVVGAGLLDEAPSAYTRGALVDRVADLRDDAVFARAVAVGLIIHHGDDRWLVRSDALLAIVADLCDAGAAINTVLDAVGALRDLAAQQGRVIADLFIDSVWAQGHGRDAVDVARRGRPLIAQAMASLAADAVGGALIDRAKSSHDEALTDLVDQLRIGVVNERSATHDVAFEPPPPTVLRARE